MSTPTDQMTGNEMAAAMAQDSDPAYNPEELADVKAWFTRLTDAREFDKNARKQYAIDRRYARSDHGQFEISVPIAATYIDILCSFLYARDPDLDIQPGAATNPPPMAEIMEMARAQVMADPATQQQMLEVGVLARNQAVQAEAQAAQQGPQDVLGILPKTTAPPPVDPEVVGQQAAQAWVESTVRAAAKQILAPYRKRQDDAKQLGQTLEVVISRLWKKAKLKAQADPFVRSCLSIGAGWLKASWQERMGKDPVIQSQMQDLQANLDKLNAMREELSENQGGQNDDAQEAAIQQQLEGLEAKVEIIVARGLAIDFVAGQDIQVAPGYALHQYREAPWIGHRIFMTKLDAEAAFPALADKLKNASLYYPQKPADLADSDENQVGILAHITADDADTFRLGLSPGASQATDTGNVLVWEVWNKDSNLVLTLVDGVDCYAKPPYAPIGTTRFYSFFLLTMLRVDGERHPQSMINRTQTLLDEMNRLHSNKAEHRRRSIPKLGFDSTQYDTTEINRLQVAARGEMIALKPQRPGESITNAIVPIQYARIDEALYDDRATRAALDMAWGIQEALAASVQTAKTATEAEIQQTGTNARTSYMRDAIDGVMDDLALYTAEVSLQSMSHQDAVEIAGPWAFWPNGITVDGLSILVEVSVKGGSSGKPDTTAQQQAWSATFPILQNAIVQIGQLRQSAPSDIADGLEELVSETLARSGERLDASRFLPPVPAEQPGPMPPLPGAAPNPMSPVPVPNMPSPPAPPTMGGANLVPVPHKGLINGHRPSI